MMHDNTPPTITNADKLLRTQFDLPAFRPGQRRVIEHLLATPETPSHHAIPIAQHARALAIFPTGAGKSLCYQLPGLLFRDGITLVVSPLMALMKDQVDALVRRGFAAACLDSSLSAADTRALFDRVRARELSILFVSPERFNNARFLRLIRSVSVALFAVDEAHCISEWGHSFRPDYLRLSRWANRLNCQRRLALTATATPRVAEDICTALGIPFPDAQVRLPSVRPNLTLRVTSVPSSATPGSALTLRERLASRVDLLAQRLRSREAGPTIVYVTLQAMATEVAEGLQDRGFPQAAPYHAGMKQEDRKRTQDDFMANKKDAIVVATIAFGMGMDHSGVRYVYHLNIPKSLEGYIQEVGRAGRDGLSSVCETFACIDDLPTLEGFCHGETPSLQSVKGVVDSLFMDAKEGEDIEYSTYDMCFEHDMRDTCLGQILAQLDLSENALEESTPFFAELVCKMLPKSMRKFPPEGTTAAQILSSGSAKITNITIDVREVAKELGLEYGRISRECDDMIIDGYLQAVTPRKMMHRAHIKTLPENLEAVATRMHQMLVRTQEQQLKRISEVIMYLSASECQSALLQRHLGDDVRVGASCGRCEYCINGGKQPVTISAEQRARIGKVLDMTRWAVIQQAALPRDDPRLIARFAAGISSPVISRKYRKIPGFGSMTDHDFPVLLDAAKKECVS